MQIVTRIINWCCNIITRFSHCQTHLLQKLVDYIAPVWEFYVFLLPAPRQPFYLRHQPSACAPRQEVQALLGYSESTVAGTKHQAELSARRIGLQPFQTAADRATVEFLMQLLSARVLPPKDGRPRHSGYPSAPPQSCAVLRKE